MLKVSLRGRASAWQFTGDEENVAELRKLKLPTGEVTVQEANELNEIEARCYVPVTWGTHILKPGDWIMLMDSGIVATFTEKQMPHMVQVQTLYEQREGLLGGTTEAKEAPGMETAGSPLAFTVERNTPVQVIHDNVAHANERLRTDWQFETFQDADTHEELNHLVIAATGRELGRWETGDTVNVYADGTVEVEPV